MQGAAGRAIRLSTTSDERRRTSPFLSSRTAGWWPQCVRRCRLATVDDALPTLYGHIGLGAAFVAVAAALSRPLRRGSHSRQRLDVRDGARRFAAGDFASKLIVPRTPQFAEVAQNLNSMAERLDQEIRTLTRERNHREAVLASMVQPPSPSTWISGSSP